MPHLENILFLFRGEAIINDNSLDHMEPVLETLFEKMKKRGSGEILRVNSFSHLLILPRKLRLLIINQKFIFHIYQEVWR